MKQKTKDMKYYCTNILICTAALIAAWACTKPDPTQTAQDMTIYLAASESGATKALLNEAAFAKTGNRIKIYDYYTATDGSTEWYIDDHVKADADGAAIWPFETKKYSWTADGVHKFFGWLAEDANMTATADAVANTPTEFFGSSFALDTDKQVLAIPEKTMLQDTPQFDFMYSNIYERNLTTNPDYVSVVPLAFSHLFTAFNVTAENKSSNGITLKSVTITGLKNKKSATVSFAASTGTTGSTEATVTYRDGSAESSTFAYTIENGINLTTTVQTISDYLLMWPQTDGDLDDAKVTVVYDYTEGTATTSDISKEIPLSSLTAWEAGKKNTLNLVFKDKEIKLICVVQNWEVEDEKIDFSDQVTVSQTITWDKNTIESIDETSGEVVLYTDEDMVATCTFKIDTPQGATWTASLIPIEGHQDAFTLVDGTKYGAVGVESTIKIKVNNQAPIAPRHVCKLRITVQTADGRTMVVNNLVPEGKTYTEFTIIQNLING